MEWLTFSYPFSVRFSDTDAYGIVHHSKYYCYFEEARYALGVHLNMRNLLAGREGVQFPVVYSSCQYRHPLVYDDKPAVVNLKCRVQAGCKIEFLYEIEKDNVVYAKGSTVHAVTEKGKLCIGTPWLENLIDKFFGKEEA